MNGEKGVSRTGILKKRSLGLGKRLDIIHDVLGLSLVFKILIFCREWGGGGQQEMLKGRI